MSPATESQAQTPDDRLDAAVAEAVAQFPPLADDVKDSISLLLRTGGA